MFLGFAVAEIGAQDGVEAASGGGSAGGAYGFENALDGFGAGNVLIGAVVAGVEEMDVDAVFVMGSADGGDGREGGGGFAPGAASHGTRVVDQEDSVEGGEEGVRIVSRWGDGCGWCGVAWWCIVRWRSEGIGYCWWICCGVIRS